MCCVRVLATEHGPPLRPRGVLVGRRHAEVLVGLYNNNNSPGQRPNGVLDLPETSSFVVVIVSRPRKVGRPRGFSVESPSDATEAVLCQSLSRSWRPVICDGFCRRIQKTPLKCSESSSRSTSILETAFFEKVSNLKTFLGDFLAFIDGATAPRKNGVNRACGHFVGLLCCSKLFLGPSSCR